MSFSLSEHNGFPYRLNIADLENIVTDDTFYIDSEIKQMFQYGNIPGTFAVSDSIQKVYDEILTASANYAGHGAYKNTLQNFLARIDRLGTAIVPPNSMYRGYTFITRPRLNLTGSNLHSNALMTTLYNSNEKSVAFMIRALLDTRLSNGEPMYLKSIKAEDTITAEILEFSAAAANSPLFDRYNPFFTPLMNGLVGISGFPDLTIEAETTPGDFHGGDFTFAKGSDMMNKTQELSLEFRDIGGSIILSCFYYWVTAIALLAKGVMVAYPDDIYERRLNYTVSIYRFITDMTGNQVQWWAKATGCFPKSVPVGALFNVSQDESDIASARRFSIPFVANDVKVNDVGTLFDFNALMRRYQPRITDSTTFVAVNDAGAECNFNSLPYIVTTREEGIIMEWRTSLDYLQGNYFLQDGKVVYRPQEAIRKAMDEFMEYKTRTINDALLQTGLEKQEPSSEDENTIESVRGETI